MHRHCQTPETVSCRLLRAARSTQRPRRADNAAYRNARARPSAPMQPLLRPCRVHPENAHLQHNLGCKLVAGIHAALRRRIPRHPRHHRRLQNTCILPYASTAPPPATCILPYASRHQHQPHSSHLPATGRNTTEQSYENGTPHNNGNRFRHWGVVLKASHGEKEKGEGAKVAKNGEMRLPSRPLDRAVAREGGARRGHVATACAGRGLGEPKHCERHQPASG